MSVPARERSVCGMICCVNTRRGMQVLVLASLAVTMILLLSNSTSTTTLTSCVNIQPQDNHRNAEPLRTVVREEIDRAILKRFPKQGNVSAVLPTIYVITPTYRRQEQIPELTRLGQTLLNVPNLHWIVADDTNNSNANVVDLLNFLGMPHTYLLTPMPSKYRKKKGALPKGVANRNAGLDWVREHATEGVIYFADDDNTYDIRLFEEMRYTKRVSMFPVGLVTSYGLSTPVLRDGKFVEFYDGWIGNRKFPVDMAGFAISVKFLLQRPEAAMPYKPGYEETGFLKSLQIEPSEMEFMAHGCTKVYVWHTKTVKNQLSSRSILDNKFNNTNLRVLQERMMLKA